MGKLKTLNNNVLPAHTPSVQTYRRVILSKEESEQLLYDCTPLVKATVFSSMIDEMKIDNQIQAIDYTKEVESFFKQCSKNDSKHTARQYRNGLSKLETYTQENDINILKLTPRESDNFCISLKDFDLSNATIRAAISSCSTFFSFLERRYMVIKNPFRGTRTRPPIRAKKQVLIPTEKELKIIIENISNSIIQMAIIFIRDTGIRVGALDTLKVKNNKYYAYSKGKDITGLVSKTMLTKLKNSELDSNEPFKNKSSEVVRVTFATTCKRLHQHGVIKESYSVHDIRHLFAVSFYKKTKDIYALKNLLNHSSIAITEVYLKSLDL